MVTAQERELSKGCVLRIMWVCLFSTPSLLGVRSGTFRMKVFKRKESDLSRLDRADFEEKGFSFYDVP